MPQVIFFFLYAILLFDMQVTSVSANGEPSKQKLQRQLNYGFVPTEYLPAE